MDGPLLSCTAACASVVRRRAATSVTMADDDNAEEIESELKRPIITPIVFFQEAAPYLGREAIAPSLARARRRDADVSRPWLS